MSNQQTLSVDHDWLRVKPILDWLDKRLFLPSTIVEQEKGLSGRQIWQGIDWDFIHMKDRYKISQDLGTRYMGTQGDITYFATKAATTPNVDEWFQWVRMSELRDVIRDQDMSIQDKVKLALQGDLQVSCNCPAFHYWGYKYIMTQLGASLSPENRPPDEKNPKRKGTVCKHLALVLRVLPFWWNDIASALAKAGYDKYTVKQRGTTTPQKKEPTRPQMPPRRTQQTARQPAKQTTRQRPQQTQIPQAKRTRKPVPSRKQTPVRAPKAGRRRESAIYTSNLLEELMKWESFQDIVSVMRNS